MRKILAPMVAVALSFTVTGHVPAAALAATATISVNSTADNTTVGDGQCTLREAIANVNASADTTSGDCTAGTGSGDTIVFAITLPAKIKLTLGELDIEQSVTIAGPTTGALVARGSRGHRVFMNTADATSISDLIIQRGDAERGGGIYNTGTMTLSNCTVSRNMGRGGSGGGGGIYNAGGTMTLSNCTLSGNKTGLLPGLGESGGGIYNAGGTVTLTSCTFSRNNAVEGGAIYNTGTMTLTSCTFTRNKAYYNGGGIISAGTTRLTNCTLSRNTARLDRGGGIFSYGSHQDALTNCTLSRNNALSGGGIGSGGGATVALLNTIVADSGQGNCDASIVSNGHNLDSDGTCFTSGGTDLVNADPMLLPLADNSGATNTMALCTGVGAPSTSCHAASPAVDAGDDAVLGPPDNLTTDQRGLPRKAGLHVDIGAYEVQ